MKIIYKNKRINIKEKTIFWGYFNISIGKVLIALLDKEICWLGINCGVNKLKERFKGVKIIESNRSIQTEAKEIKKLWPHNIDKLSTPLVLFGTDFQLKVWKELLKIKCGETTTYSFIAKRIGNINAARAVGSAVGKNPVSIIIPCHRVLNKDIKKSNFLWGLEVKEALLKAEGYI